jgi:hypothetical protein
MLGKRWAILCALGASGVAVALASTLVVQKTVALLSGDGGLSATAQEIALMSGVTLPAITPQQIIAQNVSADIVEQSSSPKYPLFQVYCERLTNSHLERFRVFSGEVSIAVEARVSQDRLDGLEDQLHGCVDAVTQALDENGGDWGDGVFYSGGYAVTYNQVKHGGRNFLQSAKVTFTVALSR